MTSISATVAEVPEVFTAREIADAAGVSADEVRALITNGVIRAIGDRFVAEADAVRAVRSLRGAAAALPVDRQIFGEHPGLKRSPGALVASGTLHGVAILAFLLLTMSVAAPDALPVAPMRLVFLALPGPGGGGGGGGLKQPAPPPKARMKGASALHSPVPPPRPPTTRPPDPEPKQTPPPPAPEPVAKPVEPPPPAPPKPLPQVVAPVAQA